MKLRGISASLGLGLAVLFAPGAAWAQAAGPDPAAPTAAEEGVRLSLPPNVELRLLIDYVSERVGINILYGDEVARARVTLKNTVNIPSDSLLGLLESSLRMNGLALIDDVHPGWKRIIAVQQLAAEAELQNDGDAPRPVILTQVFELRHLDAARAENVVRPFLTPQGSNVIVDAERGLLIVTDFESRVQRIEKLLARLDVAVASPKVAYVSAKHMSATELAAGVNQLLAMSQRFAGAGRTTRGGDAGAVEVHADVRTNRVIIVGSPLQIDAARAAVETFDTDLGLETRFYRPIHVSPERLDALVRQVIDPVVVGRLYESSIDPDGALLVVSAAPALHTRVSDVQAKIDIPVAAHSDPVQFYKLQNADAADVLATIRAIEGQAGLEQVDVGGARDAAPRLDRVVPPVAGGIDRPAAGSGDVDAPLGTGPGESEGALGFVDMPSVLASSEGREATVTADENLNAIIVVAEPAVQRVYESLIRQLDRRRPQVMIEATIVTLDTSDGFSLTVEISTGDREGDEQRFNLSSFGISAIDDDNRLSLLPGLGLNTAVLLPQMADLVLQALKTDGHTEVIAAPKVLVNDNATGTISSVAQAPVSSINQGQNSDTVTFSGFVDAGTTISVTPHIAEGDHLRLEFEVALESFTGDSAAGLPPPRSSNTVTSEVTIPDGATIVVGGINRRDRSETVSRIPILGEIPILEYLFSSRSTSDTQSTLFVFLRPVILRDDHFADLKFYSARDARRAGVAADFPESKPMMIR